LHCKSAELLGQGHTWSEFGHDLAVKEVNLDRYA
jgi:hypothetical protein